MRKLINYLLLLVVVGLLGYNSIYIKKLSAMKAAAPANFDAVAFSKKLWQERLPARLDSAVRLDVLLTALRANPAQALDQYSNSLSIGNIRYCLVKAAGRVVSVNEDEVLLLVNNGQSPVTVQLATEYVYGNAIRDASGLVNVKDFVNTTDLNNISEELNKRVRQQVLPAFKSAVQKSDSVEFAGAIELNREHLKLDALTIIPIQVNRIQP